MKMQLNIIIISLIAWIKAAFRNSLGLYFEYIFKISAAGDNTVTIIFIKISLIFSGVIFLLN